MKAPAPMGCHFLSQDLGFPVPPTIALWGEPHGGPATAPWAGGGGRGGRGWSLSHPRCLWLSSATCTLPICSGMTWSSVPSVEDGVSSPPGPGA